MFDQKHINKWFAENAASLIAQHPLLSELSQRMVERLPYIKLTPQQILHLGILTLEDNAALKSQYPLAKMIACDTHFNLNYLLAQSQPKSSIFNLFKASNKSSIVTAQPNQLPFISNSQDLIWSNLGLLWQSNPLGVFKEWQRVLKVDGWLMFSSLGPDTCKELRQALGSRHQGYLPEFMDMHDVGDMLVDAGMSEPVLDMDTITLTYKKLSVLWQDLRKMGVNFLINRSGGLIGRKYWQGVLSALEIQKNTNGDYQLTIEIVNGHAWKTAAKKTIDGHAIVQWNIPRKPHLS